MEMHMRVRIEKLQSLWQALIPDGVIPEGQLNDVILTKMYHRLLQADIISMDCNCRDISDLIYSACVRSGSRRSLVWCSVKCVFSNVGKGGSVNNYISI
jgi:hypothetical protein